MNIIAIMGPHGVFYKDEPIKELESALVAQGFQIIWPQNSVDLLKFIEHNPRICGVIFDWDEYSLDLCSDINQLNEYLPLYAFINTHSTMDVSVQDMRMALWFFEYALGQAEDIAIRMRQYTNEYLDNITPPFTKALFTYVKERKYTFCTPGHMGGTAYQKSPVGCLFYDFFGGNTLKADAARMNVTKTTLPRERKQRQGALGSYACFGSSGKKRLIVGDDIIGFRRLPRRDNQIIFEIAER